VRHEILMHAGEGARVGADVLTLLRDVAPQVLGALARRYGDFAGAEDALQEALIAAASQWAVAGIPDNPRGWMFQVALRRMQDTARSEIARKQRESTIATEDAALRGFSPPADSDIGLKQDDTLALLFMCCHPSLTSASAIALTLRAVGGLTTAEIGRAFLVPEATMAQRISRAKQTIKNSGVPFRMPSGRERVVRLSAVLHVLYLIFSEGYASSGGESLQRVDLSQEAIRLTRGVRALMPQDGEVAGLLALMLLTDARRDARTGVNGELIPLDEQDRSLWKQSLIAEGVSIVSRAISTAEIGPYQLQAAIAALHDEATRMEETDWAQILALYGVLMQLSENPMVALNHAIATSMVHGPGAALALIGALAEDSRMRDHHRLRSVRGHLLEMQGEYAGAIAEYQAAATRTNSTPERNYLITKAARLRERYPDG
jgi:predicted RNA polymerase sigma factor